MRRREYVQIERTRQNPKKNHKDMEVSNVLDKESKVMVLTTLPELGERMDERSEKFNRKRKYKKVTNRSYN